MDRLATDVAKKWKPYLMPGEPVPSRRRETIAERPDRRVESVRVPGLSSNAIRLLTREKALDPRFRPVDRYLWRWSIGQGSGLPMDPDDADGLPESRPPPLSGDESVITDAIVLRSPVWARDFVFMWFRSDKTVEEIAQRLQVRARAVYDERKLTLAYYLGRLTEAGIMIPTWEPES